MKAFDWKDDKDHHDIWLADRGLNPESPEYERGVPVPSPWLSAWAVNMSTNTNCKVYVELHYLNQNSSLKENIRIGTE
jgi:hypothetical protein